MNPVEPSKVYRLFYPQVPAILGCNDGDSVYAMPVVSVISISNEPPLVGVASSPIHATYKAITEAKRFSLCWLDSSLAGAVESLGTRPPTTSDKLQSAGLKHFRGRVLDVPIIEGAVAWLECSLYARQSLGDHELLVGKVQDAQATDDFNGYWKFEAYDPILYAGTVGGSFSLYRKPSR